PAGDDEFWAVAQLFAALHQFNASLDARFRLAANWEALLREHFTRTHTAPGALWLLAWCATEPVGLLLMESHSDSPLFAESRWAELVALYVVPEHRTGALGVQLIDAGKQWAAAHSFDRLQLYVSAANERARRFYTRCGLYPTQEIWRIDVTPTSDTPPPPDPSCEGDAHQGHHQLAKELSGGGETGRQGDRETLQV
ncbi:GNAT family N-acetyltransferase, partial [Candidatus Gracilibacteria bacterium]|nr:GNAT family N-acetyltransferase [Candidatus Gracilibacteria bacterium]